MSERLSRVIGNYEVKLRLGANGRLSERQISIRVARFGMAAAQEDMALEQTRQILCSHGVHTIVFAAYHAFRRELGKLTREEVSAESLQRLMMARVEKWVLRGLNGAVLLDIALTIYNITPPQEPSD